jgi:putative intracellular protease/amidase
VPVQAVAIVIYEGVQALDVAGPMDVFSEANTFLDMALVGQRHGAETPPRWPSGWLWLPSAKADSRSSVPISRRLPIRIRRSHASRTI